MHIANSVTDPSPGHRDNGGSLARDRLTTDTLRGLACLLIVLFHSTIEVVLRNPASLPAVVFFNDYVQFVRIPFFTFLSGYIYAYRPLIADDRFGYLQRKTRRLLLPMLFVTLLTVVAKGIMDSAVAPQPLALSWLAEIIRPSFHLWFVEALFLIFLALSLGLYRFVSSIWLLVASLVVAVAIDWMGMSQQRDFSIIPALEILPYFLAGALVRTARIPRTHAIMSLAVLTLIALGVWRIFVVTDVVEAIPYVVPLVALLALHLVGIRWAPLARLGRYSMAIFLYHALVLAALAPRLPGSPAMVLLQLTILGVGLPILFERRIARTLPALLPLTLGQRRSAPERALNVAGDPSRNGGGG